MVNFQRKTADFANPTGLNSANGGIIILKEFTIHI
jgi:hypothetical protein